VALSIAAPAVAHEEAAVGRVAVLQQVVPQVAGLEVRVAQLTFPVLFVRNRTANPFIVEGERGEPFLRIARGEVSVNVDSPTTYASIDPSGTSTPPRSGAQASKPRWRVVDRSGAWSWFDPRLRHTAATTWEVPARLGQTRVAITGGFEELGRHGHLATEMVALDGERSGLEIRLLDGRVPAIFVRNDTASTLRVPGLRGEPFLRIGPRGVFANSRSPEYYRGGSLTVRNVPLDLDPRAQPRWRRLSTEPIWSWLEYRARVPAVAEQREVLGDETRTVLEWVTPMMLGEDHVRVHGRVRWIPPILREHEMTDMPLSWTLPVGAVLAIAACGALLARRRPRSA